VIKGAIKRFVWVALATSTAVFGMTVSASAEAHHPMGNYAKFSHCPTENPKSILCNIGESTSGEFQIGNANIPITKPSILQGALGLNEAEEVEFIPATEGESLVKSAEVMSGGIFALVKEGRYPWYLRNFCKNFPNNSECKVTATTELVGLPIFNLGNLISEQGTAIDLPLRLHLKNPFLGGKCYIGSTSSPITIAYTTGSKPPLGVEPEIKGKFGHLEGIEEGNILVDQENEIVDNAYTAPKAEGCGGPQSLIVDREIDEKQALPSPAGHNRSRLIGTLYLASVEAVRNSE
jgi:hypothetical protein